MTTLRLPGGQLVPVPQGMTPQEAVAQWRESNNALVAREFDDKFAAEKPNYATGVENMGAGQRFLAGAESGLSGIGRKAVNLALPDKLTPGFATDEAIAGQNTQDAALRDTRAGFWGNMLGEGLATAPIGGGASSAGKALIKTLATQLGKPVGKAVGRQVARRAVATGATEGAAEGYVAANPEDRNAGAAVGGAVGAGGTVLARTLGRAGRGVVPTSAEAQQHLDTLAARGVDEPFLGVMASADQNSRAGKLVRTAYRDVLAATPLGEGQLRNQQDLIDSQFRQAAAQPGLPKEFASLPTTPAGMKLIDDAFTAGYDQSIGQYRLSGSDSYIDDVIAKVRQAHPEMKGDTEKAIRRVIESRRDAAGNIAGDEISQVKRALRAQGKANAKDPIRGQALASAASAVDDVLVEGQILSGATPAWLKSKAGKQALADVVQYRDLNAKYKVYNDIVDVSAKRNANDFTAKDLAAYTRKTEAHGPITRGEGTDQTFRDRAERVLEARPQPNSNLWRTLAILGTLGSATIIPGGTLAALGVAGAAGTKRFQNFILGRTLTNKGLRGLRRANQPAVAPVARAAAASEASRRDSE